MDKDYEATLLKWYNELSDDEQEKESYMILTMKVYLLHKKRLQIIPVMILITY